MEEQRVREKAAAMTTTFHDSVNEREINLKEITETCSDSLFLHRHKDDQELLDERQNMLQFQNEEPCCAAPKIRVHPNLESALAESHARIRNFLSPKDNSGCNE